VTENFRSFGIDVDTHRIALVRGLFHHTLPQQSSRIVAFAHIDCDWYDPVMLCLEYCGSRLSPGGIMISDDYNDWPGCDKATDDYLERNGNFAMKYSRPHAVLKRVA
jgi:asparagine synthase (glutamine-hydrolysing)